MDGANSGTIEVTISFNVKDRRIIGYRLAGAGTETRLPGGRTLA